MTARQITDTTEFISFLFDDRINPSFIEINKMINMSYALLVKFINALPKPERKYASIILKNIRNIVDEMEDIDSQKSACSKLRAECIWLFLQLSPLSEKFLESAVYDDSWVEQDVAIFFYKGLSNVEKRALVEFLLYDNGRNLGALLINKSDTPLIQALQINIRFRRLYDESMSYMSTRQDHPRIEELRGIFTNNCLTQFNTGKLTFDDIMQWEIIIMDFEEESFDHELYEIATHEEQNTDIDDETESIPIYFTKKQYRKLIRKVLLSTSIELLAFQVDDPEGERKTWHIDDHLMKYAIEFDSEDIIDNSDGRLRHSKDLEDNILDVMHMFEDRSFHNEFKLRMGQRDFERNMSEDEARCLAVNGIYSSRIDELYEKYEQELENHDIERIQIVE